MSTSTRPKDAERVSRKRSRVGLLAAIVTAAFLVVAFVSMTSDVFLVYDRAHVVPGRNKIPKGAIVRRERSCLGVRWAPYVTYDADAYSCLGIPFGQWRCFAPVEPATAETAPAPCPTATRE